MTEGRGIVPKLAPLDRGWWRPARIGALTALLMAGAWNGVSSERDRAPEPPSGEELARIAERSSWVGGIAEFHALREGDLQTAAGSRRRGFELFARQRREAAAQRQLLSELPYGDAISAAADRYRLDSLLLAAMVEAESRFDARVVSPRGAVGLLQVTQQVAGAADLFDPQVNLDVGARYFGTLLERFGGDVELALAAYNAGPSAVRRYRGVPPYRETSRYVKRVLRIYDGHHRASRGAADGERPTGPAG